MLHAAIGAFWVHKSAANIFTGLPVLGMIIAIYAVGRSLEVRLFYKRVTFKWRIVIQGHHLKKSRMVYYKV